MASSLNSSAYRCRPPFVGVTRNFRTNGHRVLNRVSCPITYQLRTSPPTVLKAEPGLGSRIRTTLDMWSTLASCRRRHGHDEGSEPSDPRRRHRRGPAALHQDPPTLRGT